MDDVEFGCVLRAIGIFLTVFVIFLLGQCFTDDGELMPAPQPMSIAVMLPTYTPQPTTTPRPDATLEAEATRQALRFIAIYEGVSIQATATVQNAMTEHAVKAIQNDGQLENVIYQYIVTALKMLGFIVTLAYVFSFVFIFSRGWSSLNHKRNGEM